jgi:cytidylate kinase
VLGRLGCYNPTDMTITSENISAGASIGIHGASAVGKEQSADVLAPMLGMWVINTGRSIRAATLMAMTLGQFEEGRGTNLRLRRGAADRIADWLDVGHKGLHFETRTPDISARIFFADADLTDAIKPQKTGYTRQSVMEPAAAQIATNPRIRRGLLSLWRATSIALGGAVMITKNIDEYLPEAHGVFHLFVTDPRVSARYRIRRHIAATNSLADEIAYLQERDRRHLDNGLEQIPKREVKIDMTPLLLKRNGFREAAHIMTGSLAKTFTS